MPNPDPSAAASGGPTVSAAGARRQHGVPHRFRVCGGSFSRHNVMPGSLVHDSVTRLIAARFPNWDPAGFICRGCLNGSRAEYVRSEMEQDRGELSALEEEVMHSLHDGALVTDNLNQQFDSSLTLGERVADKVADFGGSWRFIITFLP